jgi:hypothetical protein
MRVALSANIHGNAVALDATLSAIEAARPTAVVCLGDVATGPRLRACLDRVRGLACPVVGGNADDRLLESGDPSSTPGSDDAGRFRDIARWCRGRLPTENQAFIRTFRLTHDLELGPGTSLLAYHGTPESNTEEVPADASSETLASVLGDHDATVFAGGAHSRPVLPSVPRRVRPQPG